jgi:Holliday junction resolvasome RuvABC DNA-binding subunit
VRSRLADARGREPRHDPDRHPVAARTAAPNERIAAAFEEIAGLLETQAANPFRVRAYRRAADTLRQTPRPVGTILRLEGPEGLDRLPGVGPALARAIAAWVETGRIPMLERLRGATDSTAVLRSVPAIGPRLAERLQRELGIETLEELELAAHDGRLATLPGIGPKRLAAVRASLQSRLARRRASPGANSRPTVEQLLAVDREYREGAAQGRLRRIAPRRLNPTHEAWLPVLHTHDDGWQYSALFSNTARAHELGKTRDWVVIYWENDGDAGQSTLVTAASGPLRGRRVIRGREAECEEYYGARVPR